VRIVSGSMVHVKFAKLKKQFVKEAKNHPKKAAVLGLLALLAIWFWTPLVWKWVSGSKGQGARVVANRPAPESTHNQTSPAENENVPVPDNAEPRTPWFRLRDWMNRDVHMGTERAIPLGRNPFRESAAPLPVEPPEVADAEEEADSEAEVAEKEPEPTFTPATLGLRLTSTLIDSGQRIARLNNRTFREGDYIEVQQAGSEESIVFYLAQVGTEEVILEREGFRFPLRIERSKPRRSNAIVAGGALPGER